MSPILFIENEFKVETIQIFAPWWNIYKKKQFLFGRTTKFEGYLNEWQKNLVSKHYTIFVCVEF